MLHNFSFDFCVKSGERFLPCVANHLGVGRGRKQALNRRSSEYLSYLQVTHYLSRRKLGKY